MFAFSLALVMACGGPAQSGPDSPELVALFERGQTYEAFVSNAESRKRLWEANTEAARIPEDVADRAAALEGRYRILAVTVPSCTDSAWNLPGLARLVSYSEGLELRIVSPAAGGQAVMDARPTSDGRAATPTLVILNEAGEEVGCWIERPAHQRDYYLANLKPHERGSPPYQAAAREFVGWYRDDNGASAMREFMSLLEAADAGAQGCATPGV